MEAHKDDSRASTMSLSHGLRLRQIREAGKVIELARAGRFVGFTEPEANGICRVEQIAR